MPPPPPPRFPSSSSSSLPATTKLRLRFFVNSLIWNLLFALISLALVLTIALDKHHHHNNNSSSESSWVGLGVDVAVCCVVLVEVVLRFIASYPCMFLVPNKNRICVVLAVVVLANFVINHITTTPLSNNTTSLLNGIQFGIMLIRFFWILPPTLSFLSAHKKKSRKNRRKYSSSKQNGGDEIRIVGGGGGGGEEEDDDGEMNGRVVRCMNVLDAVKNQLTYGLDIDTGVRPHEIAFVMECIATNTLYTSVVEDAIQQNKPIDLEQSSFLRMFYTENQLADDAPPTPRLNREQSTPSVLDDDDELEATLKDLSEWHFDVFEANSISHNHPLLIVGRAIFVRLHLCKTFSISEDVLIDWLKTVENGYNQNPYHNAIHAADVLQCAFVMAVKSGLVGVLDDTELLGMVVAAIIHDYGHVGLTNDFLKTTNNEIAVTYNDQSILENFHACQGWKLCTSNNHNIFANLSTVQLRAVRDVVLDLVLNTDMTKHGHNSGIFSSKLAQGLDWSAAADRRLVLRNLLHVCDLSNGARNHTLSVQWSLRVMDEFFNQGDKEKQFGLAVSPNMDRDGGETAIAKCQFTFLLYVVKPAFRDWCLLLRKFCPNSSGSDLLAFLIETHIDMNIEHWRAEYIRLCPSVAATVVAVSPLQKKPLFHSTHGKGGVGGNQNTSFRKLSLREPVKDEEASSSPVQTVARVNFANTDEVAGQKSNLWVPQLKSQRSRSLEPSSLNGNRSLQRVVPKPDS